MRRLIAITLSSTLILHAVPSMAAPALDDAVVGRAQQTAATTGAINGTAVTSSGQTLPNYMVRVRNLKTNAVVDTTTSNAAGAFSSAGLPPGTYVVEVVNEAGAIVGTSAPVTVVAGVTATVSVAATALTAGAAGAGAAGAAAAGGAAAGAGISTALVITAIAVAAGVAGVVVVAQGDDPSPVR